MKGTIWTDVRSMMVDDPGISYFEANRRAKRLRGRGISVHGFMLIRNALPSGRLPTDSEIEAVVHAKRRQPSKLGKIHTVAAVKVPRKVKSPRKYIRREDRILSALLRSGNFKSINIQIEGGRVRYNATR